MPPTITYASVDVTVHGVARQGLPLSAIADLTSANMTGGSLPVHGQIVPGFVNGGCPEHHQRGHLIANTLGGPGMNPNLVTLTEGTNHPLMYEFERMVRAHVLGNQGSTFHYAVYADYIESEYSGDGIRFGVQGNPNCAFPAPSRLRLYLFDSNNAQPLAHLVPDLAKTDDGGLIIGNGTYKFHYGHVTHTANDCWAAERNTPLVSCSAPGCGQRRVRTACFYQKWHYCPLCHQHLCNSCGYGCPIVAFFSQTRRCPQPACLGQPMVLW
ncbi:MAG: DNA/RNA non-specific endonuclease [Candidatus Sulfotelmatobacter sp.]